MQAASGTVDLVIGQIAYSTQLYGSADFANAMGYLLISMVHGHPQKKTTIWTVFYPFVTPVWIALVLCTLVVTLVLLIINLQKFKYNSPAYHIIAIAMLSIISEAFPKRWFEKNITTQVKLILFIWLPMSFMISCVYRSSLLQFLVAGDFEDPPDTFAKVIERDLIIYMPAGTLADQVFGDSPYESMRLAYQHGLKKDGFYPWGKGIPQNLLDNVIEGKGVDLQSPGTIVGQRHHVQISKKEYPVGYFLTGLVFKRNSPLQTKMLPYLMTLIDSGIYSHLKDMFLWQKAKPERDYERHKQDDDLVILTWDHVGWIFLLVMCIGLALSCFAFIVENFVSTYTSILYTCFD